MNENTETVPVKMSKNVTSPVKALGLCSGGLDSILSALVLRQQRIEVSWICFETPFFDALKARGAAEQTGIDLHVVDITDDYLKMLKNPAAGYGKHMNPCMDCHALMFRKAGQFMLARGFDFLFSGEVVGQRPMSQNSNSLRYVAKHSGFGDLILRPLSAQKLAETSMEKNGLVDRSRLLGLTGRSRKPQMALAAEFGITDYPSPAGGCLLTDPGYSKRLKDLMDHRAELTPASLHLLKFGRHMRLNPETKIVVGRTKQDNQGIVRHVDKDRDAVLKLKTAPGPTVVVPGGAAKPALLLAASICAGYGKTDELSLAQVQISLADKTETLSVLPVLPDEAKRFLI